MLVWLMTDIFDKEFLVGDIDGQLIMLNRNRIESISMNLECTSFLKRN